MTPPKELADRLAELDAKATPGPWEFRPAVAGGAGIEVGSGVRGGDGFYPLSVSDDCPESITRANGEIAAALRNAAPLIVAALRLAEADVLNGTTTFEMRAAYRAARGGAE